jgi:8-oxo-dGTP pyrophosphatase MutT (NUDIX family)
MHADAPQSASPERAIVAAGGLLWRRSRDGSRLAVVHRRRYDGDWTLPKGKLQPGEDPQTAAVREVREETGWQAQIAGWAGSITYAVDGGAKLVLFWHMTPLTGHFETNDETDQMQWLSREEALARLDYAHERELVAAAVPPDSGSEADALQPKYWQLVAGDSSRAASQRLNASVDNFEADFEYRLGAEPELRGTPWEQAIRSGLEVVRAHHRAGEVDTAWRCFTAVARRALDRAGREELLAHADGLRHEAGAQKLASAWRSETVIDLLDPELIRKQPPAALDDVRRRVIEATRLRDEDANNRYYRVALIRGQRSLLLVGLVISLAVLLGLTALVDWSGDVANPSPGFVALIVVFGALGAGISAIQSLGRAGAQRIPEHIASSAITITRPVLGGAAALGVYAIATSGVLNLRVEGDKAHLTVLALAFAAGFSERLVLAAVGAATGSADQKPSP